MKKIALVVKKAAEAILEAEKLESWLLARGFTVNVVEAVFYQEDQTEHRAGPGLSPSEFQLAVVLGGDGTLLYAARILGRHGVPLLGVNMGGLGFMTEISLENLYPTLERVLGGNYSAEERMMLSVEVHRNRHIVTGQTVLNDAVINKGALARILNLEVKVGGSALTNYRADGLIISTPTGSTAYNLAAGGPIVHPVHDTIILTPICPFTLTNRPLILPADAEIEIRVDPEASDVILTSDGQVCCPLEPADMLRVRRSENRIVLIKNPYKDYFEILRTKLGWG